jgi:hypothetical protein
MRKILAVATLLLASPAIAAVDCNTTRELALNAADHRDQGFTQEQLRYPLPPRDYFAGDPDNPKNVQLQLMHQIVDELYLVPEIPGDLYAAFKAQQCHLLSVPPSTAAVFSSAAPKLKACALLKGRSRDSCAADAAGLVAPSNGP